MKNKCRLCGWCRWSTWVYELNGLDCTAPVRAGDPVRAYGEHCNYYEREPGAGDEKKTGAVVSDSFAWGSIAWPEWVHGQLSIQNGDCELSIFSLRDIEAGQIDIGKDCTLKAGARGLDGEQARGILKAITGEVKP